VIEPAHDGATRRVREDIRHSNRKSVLAPKKSWLNQDGVCHFSLERSIFCLFFQGLNERLS
jgi:hypothetical protein